MDPLFFLIFAAALAFAFVQWQRKQKRREAIHVWAVQNGLSYSAEDTFGIPERFEFGLFSKGDGRGCDNVLRGQWRGLPVTVADYWYYDIHHDPDGPDTKHYSHFSIVIAEIEAWLPRVSIERENPLTWLADKVGFRDIDFESEDFNRQFNVKSPDREFAFKLVDARMMQWLLDVAGQVCVEVNGAHVLMWSKPVPAEGMGELLYSAKGFVENVPRLVWAEYGKAAS